MHEELFSTMAALEGFDITGFDAWLAGMDECGAKRELTERRQWAKDAVQYGAVNRDALLRHLEWMLLRWKYIRRTDYLLPLARTGDKVKRGGKKGGEGGSNSKASAILAEAEKRTTIGTGEIQAIARETGAHVRTVRDTLSKAGRYMPRKKNGK